MKALRLLIAFILALPASCVATIKVLMVFSGWIKGDHPPLFLPAILAFGAALFLAMFHGIGRRSWELTAQWSPWLVWQGAL